jgi:putative membrane protein
MTSPPSTGDTEPAGEPDYRFTLANERTYLAWIRSSLALLAGGAATTQLLPDLGPRPLRYVLGLGLVCFALVLSATAYRRWIAVDEAIRADRPLPRSRLPLLLAVVVSAAIALTLVLVLLDL